MNPAETQKNKQTTCKTNEIKNQFKRKTQLEYRCSHLPDGVQVVTHSACPEPAEACATTAGTLVAARPKTPGAAAGV